MTCGCGWCEWEVERRLGDVSCRVLQCAAWLGCVQVNPNFPAVQRWSQESGCRLQSAAWLESGPDRRRALCLHMRRPVCRSAECKHGSSSISILFRYSQNLENPCWKLLIALAFTHGEAYPQNCLSMKIFEDKQFSGTETMCKHL